MEWYASRFQIVWFIVGESNIKAQSVFEKLTKQEPDHISKNPNPKPNDRYLSRAWGLSEVK